MSQQTRRPLLHTSNNHTTTPPQVAPAHNVRKVGQLTNHARNRAVQSILRELQTPVSTRTRDNNFVVTRHSTPNNTCPQRTPDLTADQLHWAPCRSVDSQTDLRTCVNADTTPSHASPYSHSTQTLATTPLTTARPCPGYSATYVSFDSLPMQSGMLPLSWLVWRLMLLHQSSPQPSWPVEVQHSGHDTIRPQQSSNSHPSFTPLTTTHHCPHRSATYVSFDSLPMLSGMLPLSSLVSSPRILHHSSTAIVTGSRRSRRIRRGDVGMQWCHMTNCRRVCNLRKSLTRTSPRTTRPNTNNVQS